MNKILIAILLLASCSVGGDEADGNAAAPGSSSASAGESGRTGAAAPRIAGLVGLYEGGEPRQPHQMCIVGERQPRFGLVLWGEDMHSCSGSGTATREGDRLTLAMEGDSACRIEASISGDRIRLPETAPPGCAYYCGAKASLGGAELKQTGATQADAMKAQDLVGEPLCGGEEE